MEYAIWVVAFVLGGVILYLDIENARLRKRIAELETLRSARTADDIVNEAIDASHAALHRNAARRRYEET